MTKVEMQQDAAGTIGDHQYLDMRVLERARRHRCPRNRSRRAVDVKPPGIQPRVWMNDET